MKHETDPRTGRPVWGANESRQTFFSRLNAYLADIAPRSPEAPTTGTKKKKDPAS